MCFQQNLPEHPTLTALFTSLSTASDPPQHKLSPAQPWGLELDYLKVPSNRNHPMILSELLKEHQWDTLLQTHKQDSHCSSCSTLRVFHEVSIKPHLPTPSNKRKQNHTQHRNCKNTPSICFPLTLMGLYWDFLHFLKLTASKSLLRGVSSQFTTHWFISTHIQFCCLSPMPSPSTNTMLWLSNNPQHILSLLQVELAFPVLRLASAGSNVENAAVIHRTIPCWQHH